MNHFVFFQMPFNQFLAHEILVQVLKAMLAKGGSAPDKAAKQ